MREKCEFVLTMSQVGVILGQLSTLHKDDAPAGCIPALVHPDRGNESLALWAVNLPLPCYCEVCYQVFLDGLKQGRLHRIRTQDFTRFREPFFDNITVRTATISKLNQAIVSLLPFIYPRLLRK